MQQFHGKIRFQKDVGVKGKMIFLHTRLQDEITDAVDRGITLGSNLFVIPPKVVCST